jgi:hypothetical protein
MLEPLAHNHITGINRVIFFLRTSRAILLSVRYKGELHRDRIKEFGLEHYYEGSDIGSQTL